MKLKRDLPSDLQAQLPASFTEATIRYAMPFDLDRDGKLSFNSWVVVSDRAVAILADGKLSQVLEVEGLSLFKLENTGDGGYIYAQAKPDTPEATALGTSDEPVWLFRFTKRHITAMAYIARGVELILEGRGDTIVVSRDKERYCDNCGRALPGTSTCQHCQVSGVTWHRLKDLSREYWKPLTLIMIPVILMTFLTIFQRQVERRFIDDVLVDAQGTNAEIWTFFAIMLTLGGTSIAAMVFRIVATNRLGTRISRDMRQRVYYKVNALQLSFVDRYEAGELMSRVVHDTDHIRRFIEMVFGEMLMLIVMIIAIAITMLIINWKMALLAIVMYPIAMVVVRMFRSKEMRLWRRQWRFQDQVNSRLQDVISGIRVVKSFGQENREAARFTEESEKLRDLRRRNEIFWATLYPFITFIVTLGSLLITGYGGFEVLGGRLTPGQLNQMIALTGMMYGPLGFLTRLPRLLIMLTTSLDRIYEILDEPIELDEGEVVPEGDLKGGIEIENMTFGYQSYDPVLKNITASIKPGEKIGLVGSSGAGKSTLINLIMKLYRVDEGAIRIDDINLRDLKSEAYHGELGIVLQESFLFSGTITDNIRYADPDASMEEVMEAARMANAHDFIVKFPDGYDTYVGESGGRLSGGEKQRIAIARAILHSPSMLILDEPTSSLDLETEVLIQEALERLTEGKTTFTIAHRLSTLKDSDRIMVIDNHQIAEFGSHNELMALEGIYHGLVMAQLDIHRLEPDEEAS